MRADKRLIWLFRGQIAEQVEEYEDAFDAVAMPLVTASVAGFMWIGVLNISDYTTGGAVVDGVVLFGGIVLAGLLTYLYIVMACASFVYAIEPTEIPTKAEVSES